MWWYDFSDITKAAVIGGPLLFIITDWSSPVAVVVAAAGPVQPTKGPLSSLPQLSLRLSWQQAPGALGAPWLSKKGLFLDIVFKKTIFIDLGF